VVERLEQPSPNGYWLLCLVRKSGCDPDDFNRVVWSAEFRRIGGDEYTHIVDWGDTPALALCWAALKALEVAG